MADVDPDEPGPPHIHQLVVALQGHRRLLYGLAMTLLHDSAAAHDVVSDVFEAMLRLEPKLSDEDAALVYARAAVVNRSRSVLRRRATAVRYLTRHRPLAVAPAADEAVLLAADHQLVLRLLDRLPRRQREAMVLRYFADLGDAEIASTLGISTSTVRSNISRGLAALAQLMKVNSHE